MRKGKEMFSDNRVKVRLDIGENAFEVRFVREYTFDMDNRLDEDMAEDVEVLVGETWTAIESINRWTRTDIEGALDSGCMRTHLTYQSIWLVMRIGSMTPGRIANLTPKTFKCALCMRVLPVTPGQGCICKDCQNAFLKLKHTGVHHD